MVKSSEVSKGRNMTLLCSLVIAAILAFGAYELYSNYKDMDHVYLYILLSVSGVYILMLVNGVISLFMSHLESFFAYANFVVMISFAAIAVEVFLICQAVSETVKGCKSQCLPRSFGSVWITVAIMTLLVIVHTLCGQTMFNFAHDWEEYEVKEKQKLAEFNHRERKKSLRVSRISAVVPE